MRRGRRKAPTFFPLRCRLNVIKSAQHFLNRHVKTRAALLLSLPLGWMIVIYLGALFALFLTSIWKIDTFTSDVIREFTLENFTDVFTDRAYFNVTIRTLMVAISVTLICAVIAIPMAFYMARIAKPSNRPILVALVLTPLWASYLVKSTHGEPCSTPSPAFCNG